MEPKNNKKIITVVGIVLALAVAIIAGTLIIQATPEGKLKRQLKLAEKYLTEMNYEQALIAYNEAIKIDSKCETAYLAMADIYIKQGEEEKAVAILEEGQKNIQTDAITEKIEEAKKKAASAKQSPEQVRQNSGQSQETQTVQQGTKAQVQAKIKSADVGEIVTFGNYEQDGNTGNGTEPIEWIVLDNQGDKMLVISHYGLDSQPYNVRLANGKVAGSNWDSCTLRRWLNSEFYNIAFNDGEKAVINSTTLSNYNPNIEKYGGSGENSTNDNVFCLSADEVKSYFTSDEMRATKPTTYAVSRGVATDYNYKRYSENCAWWLRSKGYGPIFADCVQENGQVNDERGQTNYLTQIAVRPAMWIAVNP